MEPESRAEAIADPRADPDPVAVDSDRAAEVVLHGRVGRDQLLGLGPVAAAVALEDVGRARVGTVAVVAVGAHDDTIAVNIDRGSE